MSDTSVHDADVDATGGSEPVDQTSRLPKIRRHDEFYSDHGMVGAPDPDSSDSPDVPPSSTGTTEPAGDADATALHPAALAPAAPVAAEPVANVSAAERFPAPTTSLAQLEDSDEDTERRPAGGGGWAAVLGIGGLATAAIGLFALPVQQESGRTEIFFGQLRGAAADDRVSSLTGAHSTSLVGDQIATTFWRYGTIAAIGGLAALLILTLAWGPTRRTGGALTFLGAVGALVWGTLAALQTNRYSSVLLDQHAVHMKWDDWKIGFWVGAGGLVLIAAAGMNALIGRRSGSGDDNL